jgi:flagellar biosynthetic protein FliQ
MDSNLVLHLGQEALKTGLLLAAPVLVVALLVGLLAGLIQAVTSIRDMTLTIVPKLLAVGGVTLLFGSWMLQVVLRFTTDIFAQIQNIKY